MTERWSYGQIYVNQIGYKCAQQNKQCSTGEKIMRHGASGRRSRNRGGGRRGNGNNRSQVFDSNGPDVRIRGTAYQIHEKYVALAKDAAGSGDRILEQSYLQHAEHYQRLINSWQENNNDTERRNKQSGEQTEKENSARKSKSQRPAKKQQDEDLGLPASILGEGTKKDELEDA